MRVASSGIPAAQATFANADVRQVFEFVQDWLSRQGLWLVHPGVHVVPLVEIFALVLNARDGRRNKSHVVPLRDCNSM